MTKDAFWIFTHLGNGDAFVCNALFRHYAELHKDKMVVIPCWETNLANIQWMLSDVPNIFFYPIETEGQLLACRDSLPRESKLCLGFYAGVIDCMDSRKYPSSLASFNPVLWDSEFYRQAGLGPKLKWEGFKLPVYDRTSPYPFTPLVVEHSDYQRGFIIKEMAHRALGSVVSLGPPASLEETCATIYNCNEIHCIDSSMLNLADLMETPYCKRFVFHRYARKGLPPQLKKAWEIID